jgi:hypothetical protein
MDANICKRLYSQLHGVEGSTRTRDSSSNAGHDLVIEVEEWSADVNVAEDPADTTITATADAHSLNPLRQGGG